ncbi:hypothetical protein DUNSADRAFT_1188 [Dunaliella salina]|uniref:C3H1-type domain-containing protein n=1 Tax=Dunaliella salina TaxID=3046 RepID=A0ABQ7FXU5_DUNSA|nr:hypothetical protein DUNSADRAFT_1188 [Dunaliella salina]|eukprot:KAF5827180.1 hypothetical protein DUNSADRAFT_1188 [Dunaliella salina]
MACPLFSSKKCQGYQVCSYGHSSPAKPTLDFSVGARNGQGQTRGTAANLFDPHWSKKDITVRDGSSNCSKYGVRSSWMHPASSRNGADLDLQRLEARQYSLSIPSYKCACRYLTISGEGKHNT